MTMSWKSGEDASAIFEGEFAGWPEGIANECVEECDIGWDSPRCINLSRNVEDASNWYTNIVIM